MKVRELGRFIRDQRGASRLSLRRLSKLAGISNPYLSQIERGLRRPSAEILQAIAKALRISAETLYIKAGILEERTDAANLPAVIRRDDSLTATQKQLLLDVYQSFQGGAEPRRTPVRKVAAAKKSSLRQRPKRKPRPKPSQKPRPRSPRPRPGPALRGRERRPRSERPRAARPGGPRDNLGGRAETQALCGPHPAPLRPPASNVDLVREGGVRDEYGEEGALRCGRCR